MTTSAMSVRTEHDQTYLAKPAAECCLKGSIHEGEPRGEFQKIADVETYVAQPSGGNANGHILLYFPDVWGMFSNGLLIMDGFADAGYLTLGIDYFRGVCMPSRSRGYPVTKSQVRTPSPSTVRTATIRRTRNSTTRRGRRSTLHSRTSMYRNG